MCVLAVAGVAAAGVLSAGSGHHQLTLEEHKQDVHHEEPKPYKFGYGVKDEHHGLHFDQQEASDGHTVSGQYKVHLPDGRTQVVTYTADWKNGYHADVSYEGEAAHPKLAAGTGGSHGWAAAGGEHSVSLAGHGGEYVGGGGSSYSTSDHKLR